MRHSRLGGSRAPRYMRCPGSVQFEAQWTQETSDAAAAGTAEHLLREACRKQGRRAEEFLGDEIYVWQPDKAERGESTTTHAVIWDGDGATAEEIGEPYRFWSFTVDRTMAKASQIAIDDVDAFVRQYDGEMHAELEVDLSPWLGEGEIGNADVVVIGAQDDPIEPQRILVGDDKCGHLRVYAWDTEQLGVYGLGVWHKFKDRIDDDAIFVLRIYQTIYRTGITEIEMTLDELLKFGERLADAGAATRDPNAPRTPGGKQCTYCAGRARCPEYTWWVSDMLKIETEQLDGDPEDTLELPKAEELTVEQRAKIYNNRKAITSLIDDCAQLLTEDYEAGKPTPGVKLVAGRTSREWADVPKAEEFLKSRLKVDGTYKKKLITVTQAEDALSPRVFEKLLSDGLVQEVKGKPQLAPESDPRTPLRVEVAEFEDLEADDDLLGDLEPALEDDDDFLN